MAVLVAIAVPVVGRSTSRTRQEQCVSNLRQVNRAVLLYAGERNDTLPALSPTPPNNVWWFYRDLVKSYAGVTGPSSSRDKVFACPNDRGYDAQGPFCQSAKFDYTSYVFNGVNLPAMPHIAGRTVSSIKEASRTLLTMEWTAHGPLSWHHSLTGKQNHPFYNDAENVVGFVDGHVSYVKIYYDGVNAAYTRDPIPGYEYKYSGD
jgi:hypothetical protein